MKTIINALMSLTAPIRWVGKQHIKIFSIWGIETKIHGTWILWALMLHSLIALGKADEGLLNAIGYSFVALSTFYVVFASVILHEYGHSLVGKYLGYEVKDITLIPIGGLARLEGEFWKKPWHEFSITLAGPLVNLAIVYLCMPFLHVHPVIETLFDINLTLMLFNLLPCFPMDGGRLVRSTLTMIMGDPVKSTNYAFGFSTIFSIAITPVLWIIVSPFAAVIVLFFGLVVGGAEKWAIRRMHHEEQLEKFSKRRQKSTKERATKEAQRLHPDNEQKQQEFIKAICEFDKWLETIESTVIEEGVKRKMKPKEIFKLLPKILEAVKNLEEVQRQLYNKIYHDSDKEGREILATVFVRTHIFEDNKKEEKNDDPQPEPTGTGNDASSTPEPVESA